MNGPGLKLLSPVNLTTTGIEYAIYGATIEIEKIAFVALTPAKLSNPNARAPAASYMTELTGVFVNEFILYSQLEKGRAAILVSALLCTRSAY